MKDLLKFFSIVILTVLLLVAIIPPCVWAGSQWINVWFRPSGDARETPRFDCVLKNYCE